MKKQYVALLRAISHVEMKPFREAMEKLGFTDVESYGMSGNIIFNAKRSSLESLEGRIANQFGTDAFVRTSRELARIVSEDPFGSTVIFLARTPTAAKKRAFLQLDFEPPRPVLRGKTIYFVPPARLQGKHTPFDFERALGVLGTARSSKVVRQILARMSKADKT